jgi:hypothetical protein
MRTKITPCAGCNEPLGEAKLVVHDADPGRPSGQFHTGCYPYGRRARADHDLARRIGEQLPDLARAVAELSDDGTLSNYAPSVARALGGVSGLLEEAAGRLSLRIAIPGPGEAASGDLGSGGQIGSLEPERPSQAKSGALA